MPDAPAPDPAARPEPPEPDRSVVYSRTGGHDLMLHLFLPREAPGPRPVVVLIHGGGWVNGSPRQFFWVARQLADRGLVGCSIAYRLAHQAPYPAALDDCRAAIDWLRQAPEPLAIDPDRIGIIGSSAGGQLAACLGAGDRPTPGLRAVVDVHGVHDMPPLHGQFAGQRCEQFLGVSLADAPDRWRDASPINHITADAAPMLLLHDPADPVVPYSQSRMLLERLRAIGRPAELIDTPGSGHGYLYNPMHPWSRRAWPAIEHWLTARL